MNIPDADEGLAKISEGQAGKLYGDELPEIVARWLNEELETIKAGGWAFRYLVKRFQTNLRNFGIFMGMERAMELHLFGWDHLYTKKRELTDQGGLYAVL